ncbi:MAG TPA: sodium:solute symporter family protein [Bryobacteraceae bacterium]|jgi:SSS family solute:Na+ symporter|nr:sodium:solute symporter family protein [Bryobacteraceae bacterium]
MIYAIVLAIVVGTLCVVTIIKTRSVKNQDDFLVAGRKLPWPVLVFTLLSSWIGAGSLFAGGENAYRNGFAALWQPAGGWVGLILIALIAGRARRFAQFTVPDLLETRYNATARVMGTIAIVISYTVIASYQFKGGGDILNLIFPSVSRNQGMCIIAAFVIVFTAAAGMASIAYLDLVIGGLVTTIVIIAVPLLLQKAGGWTQVRAVLPPTHFQVLGNLSLPQALNYMIPTTLLLIGNQGMYQKFFSARSERDAKFAVYGWIAGTLILETLLIAFAVIGSSLFKTEHPREIIPLTAFQGLPSLIGALLLGGVFAKVISTANNYLFSPSTNLIHDVYGRFINPRASEKRKLVMSRLIVLLLGLFALLQATRFESILNASVYAYTVYGAAVTPAVMAVFFWRRATTSGAIVSIVLGAAITVGLNLVGYDLAIYPALAASLVSLILISLLTPPPEPAKWKPFFES